MVQKPVMLSARTATTEAHGTRWPCEVCQGSGWPINTSCVVVTAELSATVQLTGGCLGETDAKEGTYRGKGLHLWIKGDNMHSRPERDSTSCTKLRVFCEFVSVGEICSFAVPVSKRRSLLKAQSCPPGHNTSRQIVPYRCHDVWQL